jgi:RND family efflux transporter MFP subunit
MTVLSALLALAAVGAPAQPAALATVEQRTVASQYTAYARVEPIRTVTVSAVVEGTVAGLRVLPGSPVRRGETLARITGTENTAELERARTEAAQARSALILAEENEKSVERTYPDLSTRQELDQAQAAVSQARAALKAAQAALANQEASREVRAPVDGTVLETPVANGDRVALGDPLLRLQPEGGLWVRASFYGEAGGALREGMRGTFRPALGGEVVPVEVASVVPPLQPDGGRSVGCPPLNGQRVYAGELGTLRLEGAEQTLPAVPTTALVMDRGKWWVLVEEAKGPRPQEVEPGPAANGWTLIRSGLEAGQRVVVKDAYLLYHRDFSKHYQPPD